MAKKKKQQAENTELPWEKKKNHYVSAALTLITLAVFAIIIFFLLNLYTTKYVLF